MGVRHATVSALLDRVEGLERELVRTDRRLERLEWENAKLKSAANIVRSTYVNSISQTYRQDVIPASDAVEALANHIGVRIAKTPAQAPKVVVRPNVSEPHSAATG